MLKLGKFQADGKLVLSSLLLWLLATCSGCTANLPTVAQIISIQEIQKQASEGREAEAKNTIGAMVLAQLAYRLENSGFASTMEQLSLTLPTETENYTYKIASPGDRTESAIMTAQAKQAGLKSYTGAVFKVVINDSIALDRVICETDAASAIPPIMPTLPSNGSRHQCPSGSHLLGG